MNKIKDLELFLKKAKMKTYASGGEEGKKKLPNGCKEFDYGDKTYRYRDRYFGYNPFIGEEVVFQNKKVIWAMNYYGRVVSRKVSSKKIYKFLREALRKTIKEKPFRGPSNVKKGDLKYINVVWGNVYKFKGREKIYKKEKLVYELEYHGGLVSNNSYK